MAAESSEETVFNEFHLNELIQRKYSTAFREFIDVQRKQKRNIVLITVDCSRAILAHYSVGRHVGAAGAEHGALHG